MLFTYTIELFVSTCKSPDTIQHETSCCIGLYYGIMEKVIYAKGNRFEKERDH